MDKEITVTLDDLTLGDLEKLDSTEFTSMLEVFEKCVRVSGVDEEDQPEALRALNWRSLKDIGEAIRDAIDRETNPETAGKN